MQARLSKVKVTTSPLAHSHSVRCRFRTSWNCLSYNGWITFSHHGSLDEDLSDAIGLVRLWTRNDIENKLFEKVHSWREIQGVKRVEVIDAFQSHVERSRSELVGTRVRAFFGEVWKDVLPAAEGRRRAFRTKRDLYRWTSRHCEIGPTGTFSNQQVPRRKQAQQSDRLPNRSSSSAEGAEERKCRRIGITVRQTHHQANGRGSRTETIPWLRHARRRRTNRARHANWISHGKR